MAGGKELSTDFYGPGEFFGYAPLPEHAPHSDSAVAVADSELVYIPQADFSLLLLHAQAEAGAEGRIPRDDLAALVGTAHPNPA